MRQVFNTHNLNGFFLSKSWSQTQVVRVFTLEPSASTEWVPTRPGQSSRTVGMLLLSH